VRGYGFGEELSMDGGRSLERISGEDQRHCREQ